MRKAEIGATTALAVHSLCAAGLATGYWLSHSLYSSSLITDPAPTLRILTVCEAPVVILLFSWLRRDHDRCSFIKAVARGLIGLPIGALINAFGAIVLGAPVGLKFWPATIYWSMLLSLFTFVPAACVFGASKLDWQQILSYSKPSNIVDYMLSVPAHGAIIGAWLGAWPMPLDWERPWQEWPICVTYGAIAGHLIGMLFSPVLIFLHRRHIRTKTE
ncbi:Glycosylphosphatidylinositol anchor biosynthesis protein 11 [Rhynchospora pubera]|uniref:Glycosylphosphatidylinositol anchor biosynthesis protein 11 n=1 Tax=Rhynchospora pubera TaxID=906938 RepID=A0AAV8F251_9POAL|nr:Glycosylphosphatidylinositol anchor biosynthesis protein 11 [Rhynchospora pubera]KAJ4802949.1 Glycosylphosphatidylinositol anchor biosynthesis protein 11 [Rhynchospora pubera]